MDLRAVLLLAWVAIALAAEESCVGRCEAGFDSKKKCQCDSMCKFYESCCDDYETACLRKITRGDTFHDPEEEAAVLNSTTTPAPTTTEPPTTTHTTVPAPTRPADPEANPCSGRPFDSFIQLKNGSIYAFRGEYFFELDERAVMPGYPKLIKDVWGISGPIDAAFTRINCQGKTYFFKGNKYWRFDDGVLDDDYPRDISVGFEKIPDDVDAAFALPATSHRGKEKVYFFKGDQYYQYEFKHQPSHEECVEMTKSSPSVLFSQYTDVYCDKWTDLFDVLFQMTPVQGHHHGPRFINKDWVGIKSPIDAVMAGRLYVAPKTPPTTDRAPIPGPGRGLGLGRVNKRRGKGQKKKSWAKSKRRQSRSPFFSLFDVFLYDDNYDNIYDPPEDIDLDLGLELKTEVDTLPVQNVYFFKRDKYYRVDLQTKRVDFANPPYPRSIAKYWLGCKTETPETDTSRAEK
ncbi:hypothetical protein AGOR_G00020770 [Albula goreensis]|uniref:SMB domain-containing protein n=1 Tax=Albula goreensis TaxID=1534307 RepID=A0A8T3E0W5_9TELE|nr:hypothetical protein AGOR_G00020770 [Albula goreensis]